MPRKTKPPRLYLYERSGRRPVWIIRDAGKDHSTRCGAADVEGANQALAAYLQQKWTPPKNNGRLDQVTIADVIAVYIQEHLPNVANPDFIRYTAAPVNEWWGAKSLAKINKSSCTAYVAWRVKQGVKVATARHDLKTLRAAVRYYHASDYGPLDALPIITVPAKPAARMNYFLTRQQVADRIRAARKRQRSSHIIRLLLIGVYSGTRPGAILRLRWLPSTHDGWFDLDAGTLYRKGPQAAKSKKMSPPARIHARLLPWLKRWQAADRAAGLTFVVHYQGSPPQSVQSAWGSVAMAAGGQDGPHIMRHTCATWLMQPGVDPYEAAGYLGMSVQTLIDTYGHHHPDFQDTASRATGKRHRLAADTRERQ